nr:putative reverse transcriptase domain-containing protein [Tanacetum cinerariifolium]
LEALYGRKCRSPVLWAEIGKSSLIGPELVLETIDKVVLIKEKLKEARDRQKSYADKRRKPLELEVGDRVLLKVSPWRGVVHFGKKGVSLEGRSAFWKERFVLLLVEAAKHQRVNPIRGVNGAGASSKTGSRRKGFRSSSRKDRTLMRLEELRFLATSIKDLDDDAYWIKKQKRLIKKKMRNDLGDEDDEDEYWSF